MTIDEREPDLPPLANVTARELAYAIQTVRGERGWASMRTRDLTRRIMTIVHESRETPFTPDRGRGMVAPGGLDPAE